MENPLLITGFADILYKTKGKMGIILEEEELKKVERIKEIMFIGIEYKGMMKKVLLIQEEIGKNEIRKIEDRIRKTRIKKNAIRFDYICIVQKECLNIFRNRVISGYPKNWHTYIMSTSYEPNIGMRIVVDVSSVNKICKEERIGLRPIKRVTKVYKEEKEREKIEREMDIISNMKKVKLEPREDGKMWYNAYGKGFLKNFFEIERRSRLITLNEKIRYYNKRETDLDDDDDDKETEESSKMEEERTGEDPVSTIDEEETGDEKETNKKCSSCK